MRAPAFAAAALLALSALGCAPTPTVPAARAAPPGDSDGDGLPDEAEVHKYHTDPRKKDTAGDGVPDGDWSRRREFTYTIATRMKILKPARIEDMSDDYQDARLIAEDERSYTVEIVYYPINTNREAIRANPDFRRDDAALTEYLHPTPTANWDAKMRDDLVAALRADGIDPDRLSDKDLVEKVSAWALHRTRTTQAFSIWYVEYPGGVPTVAPGMRAFFDRQKPDASWSDGRMLSEEVLGKDMFYGKVRGQCTSSSVYLSTILRALGIPTRVAVFIPPADPNDPGQVEYLLSHIHHHRTRAAIARALRGVHGFVDHMFDEVWVGGRWVRLNYDVLGQDVVDPRYLGLLTRVLVAPDVSDIPFASTWATRLATGRNDAPRLTSVNPYMLLQASDHFGRYAQVDNPEAPVEELHAVTVVEACWVGASCTPGWIQASKSPTDFFVRIQEWLPDQDYAQLRVFARRASGDFLLHAPGHPDVRATLDGVKVSDGRGTWQAFGARVVDADRKKLVPGVAYTLEPLNTSPTYRWKTAQPVAVTKPAVEGGGGASAAP